MADGRGVGRGMFPASRTAILAGTRPSANKGQSTVRSRLLRDGKHVLQAHVTPINAACSWVDGTV
jgi:hypothetical protein